jgi:hypothetical protein
MHYVCIENNIVVGIQSYQPAVPSTVTVVEITDEQHAGLVNETHTFDLITKTVVQITPEILSEKNKQKLNAVEREFLNSSDWKVLRHIRQKALGIDTTLTEEEYRSLEQQRNDAALRIV